MVMRQLFETNNPLESDQNFSLTVIQAAGHVLFGRKTRGFGEDKLVLPGGRGMLYEDYAHNAVREVEEETGMRLGHMSVRAVGGLHIMDMDEMEDISVQITAARIAEQVPVTDTNELAGLDWYSEATLPYDEMPYDYRLWLPYVLRGQEITLWMRTLDGRVVGGHGSYMNPQNIRDSGSISIIPEAIPQA